MFQWIKKQLISFKESWHYYWTEYVPDYHPIFDCFLHGELRWGLWYYWWSKYYEDIYYLLGKKQWEIVSGGYNGPFEEWKDRFGKKRVYYKDFMDLAVKRSKEGEAEKNTKKSQTWLRMGRFINAQQLWEMKKYFYKVCLLNSRNGICIHERFTFYMADMGLDYDEHMAEVLHLLPEPNLKFYRWISGQKDNL